MSFTDGTDSQDAPALNGNAPPASPKPVIADLSVDGQRVRVVGEIDMSNVAALQAVLGEVADQAGNGFEVDLTETTYLDSSGLSVLWAFVDKQPRVLVRTDSIVDRVLTISGFDEHFGLQRS